MPESNGNYEEVSIVLIENWKGEFLMLRRTTDPDGDVRESRGKWVPPGGHVERDGRDRGMLGEGEIEAPRRAAMREALEEANIDIGQYGIRHVNTFMSDDHRYLTHVFYAKLPQDAKIDVRLSENQPMREHNTYNWISREQIMRQVLEARMQLEGYSETPRGRNDYTKVTWEIVERNLIPKGERRRKVSI